MTGMGTSEPEPAAEASLEESAEDLYDNAPCGYLSAAPDGTIVRVNATFLRWTGYSRDELIGVKRFSDLLTAGGRIYHETHYAPLLQMQDTVREIALDVVRADGSRLPVLVNSSLRRGPRGAPQVIRTTIFNATDRKRYEAELLAARNRERTARERIERLQRVTARVAAAPDAPAVASAVTDELVAAFGARWAGLAVTDPGSDVPRVLARHGGEAPGDVARAFLQEDVFDAGAVGRGAAVALPLGAAPGMAGVLWLAFTSPREFEPEERAFMRACAEQAALALERARLYEEQRDVAHVLQQSLLTGEPPADSRFEVATAYYPAGEQLEVGGDWHDAFSLPSGKVGIVVGDVVGRGIGAASAMGQLRSGLRALAGASLEPDVILAHLDTFVEQAPAARYSTLAYAEFDPATGDARYASAGHLPPLVIRPGGVPEYFMGGRSTPLGVVGRQPRSEAGFRLGPGDGFLLYTDGLIERRGEAIDTGLERLKSAVHARAEASPSELVEVLPHALLHEGRSEDDVCLLDFRLRP